MSLLLQKVLELVISGGHSTVLPLRVGRHVQGLALRGGSVECSLGPRCHELASLSRRCPFCLPLDELAIAGRRRKSERQYVRSVGLLRY